jgi:hypothetical protein
MFGKKTYIKEFIKNFAYGGHVCKQICEKNLASQTLPPVNIY